MTTQQVLIAGQWQNAEAESQFQPMDPTRGEIIDTSYPVSSWSDCDAALSAAAEAFSQMQSVSKEKIAQFLEAYATAIEKNSQAIVDIAHQETGLAKSPRLSDVELPRTTNQLRQAAKAAREASWCMPTIDTQNNVRSMLQAIGPVAVFGPNNFPLAFGSASGGDFAAAIAAGNPVIIKAHPLHPGTTRYLAELAHQEAQNAGLPKACIQLIYAMSNESGLKLVSDKRIGATGFTGSRKAGLALKDAADKAGKLIFLELSSINPVVLLPGALEQRCSAIAEEFANSCVMAAGQLCTKPGLLFVPASETGDEFVQQAAQRFCDAPSGTLLDQYAAETIFNLTSELVASGADLLTKNYHEDSQRFCQANTLLSVTSKVFLSNQDIFQTEIFGNASLVIRYNDCEDVVRILEVLEGNLTGCIYSHTEGHDDKDYPRIEQAMTPKVGRLINDKMPTGVLVSAAMNHGGPFPASGHPGFTAVGLPASIKRFTALKCYDNVREQRLPDLLKNKK